MDGANGIAAAEILNDGGQSAETFPLKYEVYDPCAIQLDDQVILTGGVVNLGGNTFILSLVNAYSNQGLIDDETLPNLRQGRYHHGCRVARILSLTATAISVQLLFTANSNSDHI